MILTMATFKETGDQLDEGIRHVTEEVVPSIAGAQGLLTGYWVVDHENGERLSVMAWESADALAAAMPQVAASIRSIREGAGRTEPQRSPDSSRRYEVIAAV